MSTAVVKRSNAYYIDPKKIIRREGWNTRFDFGDIRKLADSIKHQKSLDKVGVLTPLRVFKLSDDSFQLRDGDRRLTAIELLMNEGVVFEEGVPVIIEPRGISDKDSLIRMFEANTGKPFLPLEEAAVFKRMRESGMSLKEICSVVQRSDTYVIETLSLLSADVSVKEALEEGKISATLAKSISSKKKDKKEQKVLVTRALTSDSAKKEVAKLLSNSKEYSSVRDTLLEVITFLSTQNDAKVFFFDNDVQDRVDHLIKKSLEVLNNS